jgi:GNAT superfamily N-acetyltransferase
MKLHEFSKDLNIRNKWVYERKINVYIRRSSRIIGTLRLPCLDLATVEVDENYRGQGIFTKFLIRFEKLAKNENRVIYVENVMNERLKMFLLTNGYKLHQDSNEFLVCLVKILK